MAKIDTSGWKEFRVGDLFEVQTTKSLDKLQLEFSDDYEYDFVGRSYINNGIQGHLKKQSFEPNLANTFSVVQIGEQVCLYRENEWYASQNIFILKPKYTKVKETSFFMSCIITKTIKIKFGDNAYASYPTKNSLTDTSILLPVDTDGNPDWDYMEEYMTEVMRESEESIENLKQVSQEKKKVDITEWKEFRVGDLFETECSGKKTQVPTGAWVPTKLLQNGETPRITVSGINNGIVGYYSDIENDNYRVYDNFISVSFLGTVFYQSGRASLDMKVHCLKPVDIVLTEAIAEFLVTTIRNAIQRYAYQDQLSSTVLSTVKVTLPVDSDGNPDWEYMEEYMSAIMKESEDNLTNLSLIL